MHLGDKAEAIRKLMTGHIEKARDSYRIASLSADPVNFLLWSHYAGGHRGIAIEVDIPQDHPDLCELTYSDFSSVFTDEDNLENDADLRHLFNGKSPEWTYEKEYRVIYEKDFFDLPSAITRVLLGPMAAENHANILRAALPSRIELVRTELDYEQGQLRVLSTSATSG